MNELLTNKIYNIKKLSYSFITKNELHKHILRKYSKIIWAGNTENMNLNSLIDTDYLSQNTNKSNFFNNTNLKYFMNSTSSHLTFLANYGLASSKWPLFKNRLSFVHSYNETTNNITIGRIRFKPGYSTQWRNARSNFKLVADLRFRYQYKLTRYLMRFLKLKYSNFFLIFEMELQNVLFRSRFVPEKNLAKSLIIFNAVYINGTLCNNLKFQLYVNDLIQLVVSLKYYILYKQIVNWSLKKKTKLRKIIISKLPSESETEDKQRSNHLSNWIFTSEGSNEDTLKYCEIDYFTLSILVIYEPFSLHEINYYNLIKYRPVTFRLYNWKYIT
jgi:ribosomal protein S4